MNKLTLILVGNGHSVQIEMKVSPNNLKTGAILINCGTLSSNPRKESDSPNNDKS